MQSLLANNNLWKYSTDQTHAWAQNNSHAHHFFGPAHLL